MAFEPDPMFRLNFTRLNDIQEGFIQSYLTLKDQDPSTKCEWVTDFLKNDDTFYLYDTNHVYGAIVFEQADHFTLPIPTFYVSIRCTFTETPVPKNSPLTSGRLLWVYALREMAYILNAKFHYNGPYLVWNKSTVSAKPYHLKMGMKNYSDITINLTNPFISYIAEHIGEDEGMNEPKVTYEYLVKTVVDPGPIILFFMASGRMDLQDILMNDIPRSSKQMGGKKTRMKKRKHLRNKSMIFRS